VTHAEDAALLEAAAREAGALALKLRKRRLQVQNKPGGSPVTNADLAVDALLTERLRGARPDYGWLSEETADDPARLSTGRQFIVDPIDGTVAYMKGMPWFTVALAVIEGGEPVVAAVYAPALDAMFVASAGAGTTLNGDQARAAVTCDISGCNMLGDLRAFQHPHWSEPWPDMNVQKRNSIAYRMALVASGEFDAAVALSRKHDWDVAAGALIASEAGATVTDHTGAPYRFNKPDPWQASLLCAAPALHPLLLARTAAIDLPA